MTVVFAPRLTEHTDHDHGDASSMTTLTETPVYPCTCRPGCPETMDAPAGYAHGWATACYRRWERAGRPGSGPPAPKPHAATNGKSTNAEIARRMETFGRLRDQGLTVAAIAAEMHIHVRAAEHYAVRYRQQQRDAAAEAPIDWPRPSPPVPGVSHWSGAAACRDWQDLFYDPDGRETQREKEIREAKARSLCASCPVRRECHEGAADRGEHWGTWAGFTEGDRERAKKERHNARRRVAARREQGELAEAS